MRVKTVDPAKEKRKIEAKKLKQYAFSNFTILATSGMITINEIPSWLNMIRQARMLDDIRCIWITTEVMIRERDSTVETAAAKDRYKEGLENLIALSMTGQTTRRRRLKQ